jgi:hypothetical protein
VPSAQHPADPQCTNCPTQSPPATLACKRMPTPPTRKRNACSCRRCEPATCTTLLGYPAVKADPTSCSGKPMAPSFVRWLHGPKTKVLIFTNLPIAGGNPKCQPVLSPRSFAVGTTGPFHDAYGFEGYLTQGVIPRLPFGNNTTGRRHGSCSQSLQRMDATAREIPAPGIHFTSSTRALATPLLAAVKLI